MRVLGLAALVPAATLEGAGAEVIGSLKEAAALLGLSPR